MSAYVECPCGVSRDVCEYHRPEPAKTWHGQSSDLLQRFAAAAVAAAPAIPLSAFPVAWPNYNVWPPVKFNGPYYVDAIYTDLNGARTYTLASQPGGKVIRSGVPEARLCATGGAPGAGPFYGCDEVWVAPANVPPYPTPNANGTHVDDVICACGGYIVNKTTGHYDGGVIHFDKGCV